MQIINDIRNPTGKMIALLDYLNALMGDKMLEHQLNEYVKGVVMVVFDSVGRAFKYDDIPDKTTIYLESTPDLLQELATIYLPTEMINITHEIANIVAGIVDDVSMSFMEELMTTDVAVVEFNRATLFMVRKVKTWVV